MTATTPIDKRFSASVAKVDRGNGVIFGWCMVCTEKGQPYIDVQNDHIPEEVMVKALCEFMTGRRVGGDMHVKDGSKVAIKHATVLFTFPLTAEIAKSLGITTEKTGALIGYKPDEEHAERIFTAYETGEYTGFSIGGFVNSEDATA